MEAENIYNGIYSDGHSWVVLKNGNELSPDRSLEFVNHSPSGFAWGYYGSGPSQLAFAILLEETDLNTAQEYYMQFKTEIIGKLQMTLPFKMKSNEIHAWIDGAKGVNDLKLEMNDLDG
jgi:hypothetical protein